MPREPIVANINMDMFLPLFPLKTVMVLGLDESDLGDDVRAVAQAAGRRRAGRPGAAAQPLHPQRPVQLHPRRACPALAMKVGYEPGSPEAEDRRRRGRASATTRRPTTCSSRSTALPPCCFTELTGKLCVQVANRATRPEWKAESFFRRFAKPAIDTTH